MNEKDIIALLNNTATIPTKIEILPNVMGEEIITLTEEDSVRSWTYSDLRYVENQGFIGQFVARTFDGEFKDVSDDFNIENRTIVPYLGVKRYDDEEEDFVTTYYKLGTFFIEKPNSDEVQDNTTFKSQDMTMLFNRPFDPDYTDSEFTQSFTQRLNQGIQTNALWLLKYTCKQAGVELGSQTFTHDTFLITSNQYNSDDTLRDVVKSIAKLAYSWARIDWDDKLYIDFTVQSNVATHNVITNNEYYNLETQKNYYGEVNRVYIGSSIVEGNGEFIQDSESIAQNGLCELAIYDNPILYTEELRQLAILQGDVLFGLRYKPLKVETIGHPWLKGNELISVKDMEGNELYTYAFDRILKYNGHIRSELYSYASTQIEDSYRYDGADLESTKLKRARVELDRQNLVLKSTMEVVDGQNAKISTVTQRVDELESKIQDIADITTAGETSYGTLDLDNVNESEPITVKIRPLSQNISYLYHSSSLFFSSSTFYRTRTLRFTNRTDNTYIDYELPANLLYYDNTHYDEFLLSYDSHTCQVTKKCKYNADGSVGLLENEQILTFDYPQILLQDGDYTITLLGYNNAYLSVRLMAKNAYTTQFYTKSETNSIIDQTKDDINLSVNQKLTNYSTTAEMNSAIDVKANQITSSVSQTYSTKTETNNAKNEAISSAVSTSDSHTDTKLTNYSTTQQMNNTIEQSITENENSIKEFVSDTYTTIETYETGIGNANTNINRVSNGLTTTNNNLEATNNNFNNYATNQKVTTIENSVTSLQTSLNQQINIVQNIQENGVDKVRTSTNYTFDSDGLDIKKSNENTQSKIDNNGIVVKDGDETLLFAGYDTSSNTSKVEAHDMSIQDHEILMGHIRVEEYSTGVGWFWLG